MRKPPNQKGQLKLKASLIFTLFRLWV
ncbi:hypothetical protein Goarm_011576, partial [Gossypium armourianum]|nr:hypothetical protein [Gossypium armourianum]